MVIVIIIIIIIIKGPPLNTIFKHFNSLPTLTIELSNVHSIRNVNIFAEVITKSKRFIEICENVITQSVVIPVNICTRQRDLTPDLQCTKPHVSLSRQKG
jgi:hypothetical protein